MNLKNYTSTVDAHVSRNKIEKLLVEAGATDISRKYVDGVCSAISFRLVVNNMPIFFMLPAKVDACFKALWSELVKPWLANEKNYRQQAERTAWKLVCDWVSMQLTMIRLEQVEALQVFLPYVYDMEKDETFYDKIKNNNLKLLTN